MKEEILNELIKRQDETIGKLESIAERINVLYNVINNIGIKREWLICKADNTYSLGNFIDAQSLYVDNIAGSKDIKLVFDNEPVGYIIKAGTGQFIPCIGAKSFMVDTDCHILAINRLIY